MSKINTKHKESTRIKFNDIKNRSPRFSNLSMDLIEDSMQSALAFSESMTTSCSSYNNSH